MSHYEPCLPRLAIGAIALLMTASTFAAFVVVPSEIEVVSQPSTTSAVAARSNAANPEPRALVRCSTASAT
jgi:hypothetical protein